MIVPNQLSRDISLTEEGGRLDAACKRLLANKKILAWIMKYCMEEYSNSELRDIEEKYIEGHPDVASIAVHQDEEAPERITTGDVESTSVREGTVMFDIRFWARYPKAVERVRMNIDIEAQNDFYPGYPLVKYQIQMTKTLEMEVNQMCNYSEYVFDTAWNKGWNKGWNNGWNDGWNNGKEAVDKLYICLKKDGRINDLLQSIGDEDYQRQLMLEYEITWCPKEETEEETKE